ncbi:hypothetical protein B2A_11121, partial [mine drainage metagenome]
DIRTYGLYEDKYYWQSQEEYHVKYIKARMPRSPRTANA